MEDSILEYLSLKNSLSSPWTSKQNRNSSLRKTKFHFKYDQIRQDDFNLSLISSSQLLDELSEIVPTKRGSYNKLIVGSFDLVVAQYYSTIDLEVLSVHLIFKTWFLILRPLVFWTEILLSYLRCLCSVIQKCRT